MRSWITALMLVATVGGCKRDCPYLVTPAKYGDKDKTLDCETTQGLDACFDKASRAANVTQLEADRVIACRHSRRAARAEAAAARKSVPLSRRDRLLRRAARNRDAEADHLRQLVDPPAPAAPCPPPANAAPDAAPDAESDAEPDAEPNAEPNPSWTIRVLVTRHAQACHEPRACKKSCDGPQCPLSPHGRERAQMLATLMTNRLEPECVAYTQGVVRTEETAHIVSQEAKAIPDEAGLFGPLQEFQHCQWVLLVAQSHHFQSLLPTARDGGDTSGRDALLSLTISDGARVDDPAPIFVRVPEQADVATLDAIAEELQLPPAKEAKP